MASLQDADVYDDAFVRFLTDYAFTSSFAVLVDRMLREAGKWKQNGCILLKESSTDLICPIIWGHGVRFAFFQARFLVRPNWRLVAV